ELAGDDVVRLLDADLLQRSQRPPILVEAVQDYRLVRHPRAQFEGAAAAIAMAIQNVVADSPVIPRSGARLLDDGPDGEGDRLKERGVRARQVYLNLVCPDLLDRRVAHGPGDGAIHRFHRPCGPLGRRLEDLLNVPRDVRPRRKGRVRVVGQGARPIRLRSATYHVIRDVIRENLFQNPGRSVGIMHDEDPPNRIHYVLRVHDGAAVKLHARSDSERVVPPVRRYPAIRHRWHFGRETRQEDRDVLDAGLVPDERLVHVLQNLDARGLDIGRGIKGVRVAEGDGGKDAWMFQL